ncbi:MAG: hypothetical protein ACK5HA_00250 [Planctomycetaceae bacterium]|jgi:hypothetical protein
MNRCGQQPGDRAGVGRGHPASRTSLPSSPGGKLGKPGGLRRSRGEMVFPPLAGVW